MLDRHDVFWSTDISVHAPRALATLAKSNVDSLSDKPGGDVERVVHSKAEEKVAFF